MLEGSFRVFEKSVIPQSTVDAMSQMLRSKLSQQDYVSTKKRHFNAKIRKAYLRSPRLFSLMMNAACHERVVKTIRASVPDPVVQHVDLLIKDPKGPATLWHQDRYYWKEFDNPESMMTLWVTLVPCNVDNGCLRLIEPPKRELFNHLVHEHDKGPKQSQYCLDDQIVNECSRHKGIVDAKLEPGGAVMFDSFALHSAYPNGSDDYRLAFKIVVGSAKCLNKPYLFRLYGPAWRLGKWVGFLPQFVMTVFRIKAGH